MNVPGLARLVESSGIPTVVVTMMPEFAERAAAPRVVGVPFPFGQPFGMLHDEAMQRDVARAAIDLVASASEPGARIDLEIEWPIDDRTAYKTWQPAEPSPIVKHSLDEIRRMRRAAAADAAP